MISLKRLAKSFIYAGRGLVKIFREEQNFRIEVFVGFLVIVLAFLLSLSFIEIAILIVVIGFVLLMEIMNTLVEAMSDLLKPKLDHYVKIIKDMGAAAVMLSALVAISVGFCIFWPHIKFLVASN